MALVLAIGSSVFLRVAHAGTGMLELASSLILWVPGLGWLDGWGLVGHFSLHASSGFLTVWQSCRELSYLVAGISQSKSRNSQVS